MLSDGGREVRKESMRERYIDERIRRVRGKPEINVTSWVRLYDSWWEILCCLMTGEENQRMSDIWAKENVVGDVILV